MKITKFNKQQEEAINFHDGACAVVANPGSGKSTVLVNRIKNLIDNHFVDETDITAISFTKNTAEELKIKLKNMGYSSVNVSTFHGLCAKLLAREGKYYAQEKMIQDWQVEKAFNIGEDSKIDVGDIRSFISYQKNYLKTHTDTFVAKDSEYSEIELRNYFRLYESFKKANGLHDYDDYLIDGIQMLRDNPKKYSCKYMLVDESQDSNLANNLLVKELCVSGNIFSVFDPKQAVYTFRGGNPEYCMNFDKEWDNATVIKLDINYRSSKLVVHKANEFIKRYYGNYEHYSDAIAHREEIGTVNILSHINRESESVEIVNRIELLLNNFEYPNEIAVLYRLNSHSIHIEHELIKRKIDYDITSDGSFFKRKEIAGILAYLKLIINPHDDGAFLEIFKMRNYPLAYLSGKVLEDIKRYSGTHNLSLFEALIDMRYEKEWQSKNATSFGDYISKLRLQKDKNITTVDLIGNIIKVFQIHKYIEEKYKNPEDKKDRLESLNTLRSFAKSDSPEKFIKYITNAKKKKKDSRLRLMSCHASKGLEMKNIFLIGVEDGKFPHERSSILDEARLFFVGITRPKDNLTISEIGTDNRFIKEYR